MTTTQTSAPKSDHRHYGSKCDGQWRPAADIAKDIRSDLKAAAARGPLAGLSFSVRCESYSMGQSISVTIVGFEGDTRIDGCVTLPAKRVQDAVQRIVDAYNWDGSDIMTDYFDTLFHSSVHFESDWDRRERARLAARRAELRANPVPKRDKRGLARHLREHHRMGGTDRASFDVLASWHRMAHKGTVTTGHLSAPRHTDHDFESFGAPEVG